MAIIDKIEKALEKNVSKGVTASRLAKSAGTTTENVYRRIYDLRNEGLRIYSNRKQNKVYYRLAV